MINIGLLIIRVVIGVIFMGHGAQKLFGWFGGYGIKGTGGWFESIGIKPGTAMALLAGLTELIGGILFTLGLLTPLAGIMIAGTMVWQSQRYMLQMDYGQQKMVTNIT